MILILLPAGIAAAYNEYCNYVVDICDIGVESFATRAQAMLVDHLHAEHGDGSALSAKKPYITGRTYLGEEHMQRLLDLGGNGNAFISTPILRIPDHWQGNVGWSSVSAYQDAELQLRDQVLFQAS